MWRYHCIRAFRQAHKAGQLRFTAKSAFLKKYACFNKLMSELYKLTWYAHIGACLLDPRATVRYIGRYTKRAVLAEYRITHYDGKVVRFAYKDYAKGGKTSFKTLPVLAFIGRLIRQSPTNISKWSAMRACSRPVGRPDIWPKPEKPWGKRRPPRTRPLRRLRDCLGESDALPSKVETPFSVAFARFQ
jgi:hypothetical protein